MQIEEKNVQTQPITKPNGESFTFNMIEVEGGTFIMGEVNTKHEVKLDSFLAAEYPVTQDLYEFVTGKNPSIFLGKHRPVEQVNWYDAVEFCNALSEIAGLEPCYHLDSSDRDNVKFLRDKNGFRLPTEAEWEYAARGGKHWEAGFEYAGNNDLKKVGWYDENSHRETLPVGLKAPNQLGLYDMSGNVWEWCWDWYDKNYYKAEERNGSFFQKLFGRSNSDSLEGIRTNPLGAKKGIARVVRGGSWFLNYLCRVAYRDYYSPDYWNNYFGFRLFRGL